MTTLNMTYFLKVNNKRQGDDDEFSEILPDRFEAYEICKGPISYSPKNYNRTITV
jgi:hypothetical protein